MKKNELTHIDIMEKLSRKKSLIVEKNIYKKRIKESEEMDDGFDGGGIRKANIQLQNKSGEKTKSISAFMHLDYLDQVLEATLSFGLKPIINKELLAKYIIEKIKDYADINDVEIPNKYYETLATLLSGKGLYVKPDTAENITKEILKKIFKNSDRMFQDDSSDDMETNDKYEPSDDEILDTDKEFNLKEFNKTVKTLNRKLNEKSKLKNDINNVQVIGLYKEAIFKVIVDFQSKFSIFKLRKKLPNNIFGHIIYKDTVLYIGDQNVDEKFFNPFNSDLSIAVRVPVECVIGVNNNDITDADLESIEEIGKINLELTKKITNIFNNISSQIIETMFGDVGKDLEYITKFDGIKPSDTKL